MQFKFDHSLMKRGRVIGLKKRIEKEILNFKEILNKGYNDEKSFVNLVSDKDLLNNVYKIAHKYKNFNSIIVVGIGGSNLGTIAILEAIKGKYYNEFSKTKIYFADTTDPDNLNSIIKLAKGKVLLNIVTKSGTTTETIANFEALFKKFKNIVITTDKGSKLWFFAKEKNFDLLEIPHNIGGRYSVFSNVSLFPLILTGINVRKLLNGALVMRNKCLNSNNPAFVSASLVYLSNKKILDNWYFSNDLESLGKWYRQLMAESIGKNKKGITPIISIGSTDLHSMFQLNLDGPKDKFTCFLSLKKFNSDFIVSNFTENKLVEKINNKSLSKIMNAILNGVKITYMKNKLPYVEIILDKKDEYNIGKYMMFKMIEIVYLASLFNVNAFDQPRVEEYKEETRKLL